MYLAFNDLVEMFEKFKGVQEADHWYYTVTDSAKMPQPRGLFLPISDDSGDLLEAIANGAIAAVWDSKKQVPHYTPNHFPVFYTDEPVAALRHVLKMLLEKLDGEIEEKMIKTNFVILNKELLKENKQTYDIAVMLEKIAERKSERGE
ncbi:hypothetical protein ACWM35_02250 [Neobacillus sp. K501]